MAKLIETMMHYPWGIVAVVGVSTFIFAIVTGRDLSWIYLVVFRCAMVFATAGPVITYMKEPNLVGGGFLLFGILILTALYINDVDLAKHRAKMAEEAKERNQELLQSRNKEKKQREDEFYALLNESTKN